MDLTNRKELLRHLEFIYGTRPKTILPDLDKLISVHRSEHPPRATKAQDRLSERDIILITYSDQISSDGEAPLKTLHGFLNRHLKDAITGVHFLPFFPYTSDDGFSVVDYLQVDPALGDWDDVEAIGKDYRLMFDAVINHISAKSDWFQAFLEDKAPYTDYFITEDPATDLSMIVRPRTSPLLTPFETPSGTKHVWTTFSDDQIDLNFEDPHVLLEVLNVLLTYAAKGAEIIRLDAVTYLWKEPGHESVHHPKTHAVLQLIRSVMELAAPQVVVLTETNVPHEENISYFGDGTNEAQMVYNFALPPLVLHSYLTQDASALQTWAAELKTPSDETTFFNFLASHDGVGVRPVESILGQEGIDRLVGTVQAHGGLVSFKTNSDGSQSPYELNINYYDALNNPNNDEEDDLKLKRFLGAQSVMLALKGVPGIYVHSLLGSRSHHAGVEATGRNRSINREKFELERLEQDLADPNSLRHRVLKGLKPMLKVRQREKVFHPQTGQEVLETGAEVFALKRFTDSETVYCLHNISTEIQSLELTKTHFTDLFTNLQKEGSSVVLEPLETRWLKVV